MGRTYEDADVIFDSDVFGCIWRAASLLGLGRIGQLVPMGSEPECAQGGLPRAPVGCASDDGMVHEKTHPRERVGSGCGGRSLFVD